MRYRKGGSGGFRISPEQDPKTSAGRAHQDLLAIFVFWRKF